MAITIEDALAAISAAQNEKINEVLSKLDEVSALINSDNFTRLFPSGIPQDMANLLSQIGYYKTRLTPVDDLPRDDIIDVDFVDV